MGTISLVVVDRERASGQLLARSLHALPELRVLACVQTLGRAEQVVAGAAPDVIVLDATLAPHRLGSAIERLRAASPGAEFVVTAAFADVEAAFEAVVAGARAFVPKDAELAQIREAVVGVVLGETWLEPATLTAVLDRVLAGGDDEPDDDARRLSSLTRREVEVLDCMIEGLDQRRIAHTLGLSVNTVRTHTQHILAKLEVHTRLEAVSVALHAGFVGRRERHPTSRRPLRADAAY